MQGFSFYDAGSYERSFYDLSLHAPSLHEQGLHERTFRERAFCQRIRQAGNILLVLLLIALAAHGHAQQRSPEQDAFDRLQQQKQQRRQRQQDEALLPGLQVPPLVEDEVHREGPCFAIHEVLLTDIDGRPSPFPNWLRNAAAFDDPDCVYLAEIRHLQQSLSNLLVERGYVTSRVLLPEQDVSDGHIRYLVLAGRVGGYAAEGMPTRLVRFAMPGSEGRLVNLRELEQAIENLGRLPGLDAKLDLLPGEKQGETLIQGQALWPRRTRGSLVLNGEHYGDVRHATARASMEVASPFGMTDRVTLALNSDLDRAVSDRARGAALDYDLALGFWLTGVGVSRQEYENRIEGIFQSFDSEGYTNTGRAELTRVLMRTARTRVALGGQLGYSDVRNLLERSTVQVSSYRLTTAGLRLNITYQGGPTHWSGGLIVEQGRGAGPATELPGGLQVADQTNLRSQWFLNASRPLQRAGGFLQGRLMLQYSDDALFPAQRFSLASASGVRGYESISVTGNSALSGSLEYSRTWMLGVVRWRPFIGLDVGLIPDRSNEFQDVALASLLLGADMDYRRWRFRVDAAHPLESWSTESIDDDFTFRATLSMEF